MENLNKFSNYYKTIKNNIKTLMIFNGVVFVLFVVISLLLPKWYKSTAVILVSDDKSAFGVMSALSGLGIGGLIGGSGVDHNRYLSILYSRSLMESVIEEYNLIEEYDVENMERAVEAFENNLEVEVGDEMQVFVSVLDKDQDRVAEMTEFVINALDSINIELSTGKAKNDRDFIYARFNMVMDSLVFLEKEIKKFMITNNVIDLQNQVLFGIENAAQLQAELMRRQIELKITEMQTGPENSNVKNLETQISVLKGQFDSFFEDHNNRLVPAFTDVPDLQAEFTRLKRKVEYYLKLVEYIAPEYEQARIKAAKEIPTIQVLDQPKRPERKSKPKRAFIVLGAVFLSGIISAYYVYWKEYIKPTIKI